MFNIKNNSQPTGLEKHFGGKYYFSQHIVHCVHIDCLFNGSIAVSKVEADWKALWSVVSVQISPYSVVQNDLFCWIGVYVLYVCMSISLMLFISSFILCSAATRSILKLLSQRKVVKMGNDCPGGKADCVQKSGCLQLSSSGWPEFEPSLFRLFD